MNIAVERPEVRKDLPGKTNRVSLPEFFLVIGWVMS
jgi:hypothetical protein